MKHSLLFIFILLSFSACKKFLDAKPDASLAVPSTIKDLQAIMDNYSAISGNYPAVGEAQSDNYYTLSATIAALPEEFRNLYLWQKENRVSFAWAYTPIYSTNVVLDELAKIERTADNAVAYDNVKGCALFIRATYYYAITQLYAPPYAKAISQEKSGIPLRLTSDYNTKSDRSTLQENYDRIISDFKQAAELLPLTPIVKTRGSKPAVYGSLARTYLAMGEYQLAEEYADSCLKHTNTLLNYNDLAATANAPFPQFNKEVIFHIRSITSNHALLNPSSTKIDSTLYKSYATNDIRRTAFFKASTNGTFTFKGDYDGKGTSGFVFGGIVVDEVMLTRAECRARNNKVDLAMQDLNALLSTRWKTNTYVPFIATTFNDALKIILEERRKELISRGTRWTDLRRLMNDPIGSTTPKRNYDNQLTLLQPNSPRYTLLLPLDVIQRTDMLQNP